MAVEKMGYREQSQCMLSTIMFWNSLLAGRLKPSGSYARSPGLAFSKNRRINGRETGRRNGIMKNRNFLQCAVTNEVKMRVLLH